MNEFTTVRENGFLWRRGHEQVCVVPWGRNGVRVRVTREAEFLALPNGLLDTPPEMGDSKVEIADTGAALVNGAITVGLAGRFGQLTSSRSSDGREVLKERHKTTAEYHARTFIPEGGTWKIEQRFFADDAEKFYGLGQRQHGYLDQKGCVLDLMHRNTEVSIPFLVSNKGYGFLGNHPGLRRVELGRNDTRWVADAAHPLDYTTSSSTNPRPRSCGAMSR